MRTGFDKHKDISGKHHYQLAIVVVSFFYQNQNRRYRGQVKNKIVEHI
jgi:hypothetical protein